MGTNTLATYTNGTIIDASHPNEITQALLGSFVGRNTSGAAAAGQSLGTAALPWGAIYGNAMIINGQAVDTSQITSIANRVISGKTRTTSSLPQFVKPAGTGNGASLTVEAATTNLVYVVNGTTVTMTADIVKSSLTTAPATNNTCTVNQTMTSDKYAGEDGEGIVISGAGSEITGRVGQFAAFKVGTSEIFLAYIESSTKLSQIYRGFFFGNGGAPIVREGMSNGNTLTLYSLGWLFAEDNGTTLDATYKTPVYSYAAPTSPVTGDYWYDITNQTWKRYSGTQFEVIDRTLIGMFVLNTADCIGARSLDIYGNFSDFNNIDAIYSTSEIIISRFANNKVSVYGGEVIQLNKQLSWNITTDLESPQTEASSTVYYLYISVNGQAILSNEKPHLRHDLKGYYHPYNSWRCLGNCYNDGSSNLSSEQVENEQDFKTFGQREYTLTVTGTNWTTTIAKGIPYKTKYGFWRFKFVVDGAVSSSSRTTYQATVTGINVSPATTISAFSNAAGGTINGMYADTDDLFITHTSATTTHYYYSGDVPLSAKPTFINYPK